MRTILCFMLLMFGVGHAQNTLQLGKSKNPPPADISAVSWMAGHWKGKAFGGDIEELWSPTADDSMMFVFRLLVDGKVSFYEIGHIREWEGSLVFELKHFNADLHGWEEKDEVKQFKLVKVDENRVYFDGFTFEKRSANEINIYGLIGNDDGSFSETVFNYKRQ